MKVDDRPQCKGMTTARIFPPGSGRPDVPSRPCRNKARRGRDFCPAHEPDQEFNESVRRQHVAEHERYNERSRQRDRDQRLHWLHAVERRLAQLARLTLAPDANPHRCATVGVLSFGYPDHGGWVTPADYELPELVQCDCHLGHPEGQHICLAVLQSYGQRSVEWRD